MSLDYNEKNITLAKNLRKNATSQENRLWYDFLAKYEIRFQRQIRFNFYRRCKIPIHQFFWKIQKQPYTKRSFHQRQFTFSRHGGRYFKNPKLQHKKTNPQNPTLHRFSKIQHRIPNYLPQFRRRCCCFQKEQKLKLNSGNSGYFSWL